MCCSPINGDAVHTFSIKRLWYQLPSSIEVPQELWPCLHLFSQNKALYGVPAGATVTTRPCPRNAANSVAELNRSPTGLTYFEEGLKQAQIAYCSPVRLPASAEVTMEECQSSSDMDDASEMDDALEMEADIFDYPKPKENQWIEVRRAKTPPPATSIRKADSHSPTLRKSAVPKFDLVEFFGGYMEEGITSSKHYSPSLVDKARKLMEDKVASEQPRPAKPPKPLASKPEKVQQQPKQMAMATVAKSQPSKPVATTAAKPKPQAAALEKDPPKKPLVITMPEGMKVTSAPAGSYAAAAMQPPKAEVIIRRPAVKKLEFTEEQRQLIYSGKDPRKVKLADIYIVGMRRIRRPDLRGALRADGIPTKSIVDIQFVGKNVTVLVTAADNQAQLHAELTKLSQSRSFSVMPIAFNPLDISKLKGMKQYSGKTDAELTVLVVKQARERLERQASYLPTYRTGLKKYYSGQAKRLEQGKALVAPEQPRPRDITMADFLVNKPAKTVAEATSMEVEVVASLSQ